MLRTTAGGILKRTMIRHARKRIWLVLFALATILSLPIPVAASPFGQGKFGADVPFGSATSLAINLGGNVSINLAPDGSNYSGAGSHIVTVTSTDVVGYTLYVHTTGSTDMSSGSASIAASANSVAGPLAVGTWGYNTTGSTTNFLGMASTSSILKESNGPFKNGDPTTITYGALAGGTQPAGNYSIAVTYTAVARDQ
jgi:hypothetical protein